MELLFIYSDPLIKSIIDAIRTAMFISCFLTSTVAPRFATRAIAIAPCLRVSVSPCLRVSVSPWPIAVFTDFRY